MNIEELTYDDILDRINARIFFQLMDFEHDNILFSPSAQINTGIYQGHRVATIIKHTISEFLNDYESKIIN